MGKKSPAPPPAPDYTTLAIKQGEANMAAARQSAYMSNPNIYTPTGTQTVEWTKTPTVDKDAYNNALQAWQDRGAQYGFEGIGEAPSEDQFTTFIEQPTVRQTINPNTESALREQELAQLYMSQAASGAASGLGNLGIASAFNAGNLPGVQYNLPSAGAIDRSVVGGEQPGYTDIGYATAGLAGAPQAGYTPIAGYNVEGLPGQVGAGERATGAIPVQGASNVQNQYFGMAGAGPAAPTNLGQLDESRFYSHIAPGGFDFGAAFGGPSGGLFGMAGAGPQGLNLQGLDLSGLGGVAGGPQQGQFGYAQQFVGAPQLQGQIDVSNIAQGPINAGTTAQQAILSRLSPQLQPWCF